MARAIDADADVLISKKQLLVDLKANYQYMAVEIVNVQKPIDPVKHGKWTQTYASWSQDYDTSKNIRYRCSECNGIAVWDTKYCPSCGARMDGAIDEN